MDTSLLYQMFRQQIKIEKDLHFNLLCLQKTMKKHRFAPPSLKLLEQTRAGQDTTIFQIFEQ